MTARFLISIILISLAILIPTQILGISAGADSISGTYASPLLPASSFYFARQYTLTLHTDNKAELKTDFVKGEEDIIETGSWYNDENNSVSVMLDGRADGTVYEAPVLLTLAPSEEGLIVVDTNSWPLPQDLEFQR